LLTLSEYDFLVGPATKVLGYFELWQNGSFLQNNGLISPLLAEDSTHKYGTDSANSYFRKLFYFVDGVNYTYYGVTYTADTLEVVGNVKCVMIDGVLFDSVVSYNSTNNYTIITAASNPFPALGETADVKIKYN